ncbi:methylmalonyl Co-A mutase-associated GTPase MeaB [Pradoshia eiseniae]|uniref:Methylmalonyl Co-A mutase-associated GTPase MeaB n=1 Tax=Pradoshia eiseniae TaxID=2064768 RepID=A0A2S7N3N0_9BACI|nr:methylmalonyl Co-A mutase-associated GTPase MeaB [Pradoshia eiseniae]PQD96580.1 methylmalonyl Co-A mutase-associated GTPase MeaB [Pradoshia eiseniae]
MDKKERRRFKRKETLNLQVRDIAASLIEGEVSSLSKAITLVESRQEDHQKAAQAILAEVLPETGKAVRIGISGVPGAGKSTFIESFGLYLCALGHKVAVLAIDPSSPVSGGSILGDKTRMEKLSRHSNAYIRPTPSDGEFGGVHRKTRESMLLCEAAGYSVIIVETVGVGQSEADVREMVDFFLLLALTGAGDELQGMKKGILELVDAIAVNKADGDNLKKALLAKEEYSRVTMGINPATMGWNIETLTCSALYQEGLEDIWKLILAFMEETRQSGVLESRRRNQAGKWLQSEVRRMLVERFLKDGEVRSSLQLLEDRVKEGTVLPAMAAKELIDVYFSLNKK